MITRWVKAGARRVQISRACGFHVSAALGNATSDAIGNFHRNVRKDRSNTTTSTARGTAATGLSSLVPNVNKSNYSFGCLGLVRCASTGSHRWNRNVVERASRRTHLTQFSMAAEYPPTLSSMRARGSDTAAAATGSISRSFRKLSTTSEEGSKAPEGSDGAKKVDVAPVAEAGIAELTEGLPEEPRHSHVEMPSITDVRNLNLWDPESRPKHR
ncbi:unnamed protein product [Laminaria digitata]